jgi:molybdopterin converting factor small subunit
LKCELEKYQWLIKNLREELGDDEAEFDEEDDPNVRRVRRECKERVNQYEERMSQLSTDMQQEIDKQVELLQKAEKERDYAPSRNTEGQKCSRARLCSRRPKMSRSAPSRTHSACSG